IMDGNKAVNRRVPMCGTSPNKAALKLSTEIDHYPRSASQRQHQKKMTSYFHRADAPYPHLFPLLGNGFSQHHMKAKRQSEEERKRRKASAYLSAALSLVVVVASV
ncbi:hypothetical protein EJB05_18666, partial [Eragrostis curvula]